jgi:hypothetical protein
MNRSIDWADIRSGNLTAIKRVQSESKWAVWRCRCDCGREVIVPSYILSKKTGTCGNLECSFYLNRRKSRFWKPIIEGNTVKIPLGNSDKFSLIDLEDLDRIKGYNWCINCKSGRFQYVITKHGKRKIKLHRLILDEPEGMFVDHINHDTLDNRRCNLRLVTNGQNMQNSIRVRTEKGVSFHKRIEKFQAYISLNKKRIYLGYYKEPEDAIQARKQAEIKYHGNYRLTIT